MDAMRSEQASKQRREQLEQTTSAVNNVAHSIAGVTDDARAKRVAHGGALFYKLAEFLGPKLTTKDPRSALRTIGPCQLRLLLPGVHNQKDL